ALEGARSRARSIWVLADCCRAAPGLERTKQATGRDLRRGVDPYGNLVICTASEGDAPSYESDDLKHGIFTRAWLEALRGAVPETLRGLYDPGPRGGVLRLWALQALLAQQVINSARDAGVKQRVEFPRLDGPFSPSTPFFVPAR